MDLDFSKIDSLGSPQKPANEPKEVNSSKTFKKAKKPTEGKIEPRTQALQRKADNRQKQLEDSARVLKEYQKNKRLTTELVTEITKGVQQGTDIYDLFLKAVEALSPIISFFALIGVSFRFSFCAPKFPTITHFFLFLLILILSSTITNHL